MMDRSPCPALTVAPAGSRRAQPIARPYLRDLGAAFATLTSMAAIALLLWTLTAAAAPAAAALSATDQLCLTCHSVQGLEKPLQDGQTLPLRIDGTHFADSVHAPLGCTGCHVTVDLKSHPPQNNPIASRRDFSMAMSQQICGTCHSNEFQRWSKSVHAALFRDGNQGAPVCVNCHSPHAMAKGQAAALDTVPCKSCHESIFAAYLTSVHGMLRRSGDTAAPLCYNCHDAHQVEVPSAGVGRRDVCLGCHTEAPDTHRLWLPNVDLHFSVITCPVCHTPNARRVVDLVLYNSATHEVIPKPQGIPQFETLISPTATSPGLNSTTLMTLLGALNRPGDAGTTAIRGRLEVRTGIEDHQLTFAAKAISTCDTCHRAGSAAFQSVEISVAGPAGIPVHVGASQALLTSVFSMESVGGFYAIGGTRVTLLDVLLVLALLGGIGGPAVHFIARVVFKRFQNHASQAQRSE